MPTFSRGFRARYSCDVVDLLVRLAGLDPKDMVLLALTFVVSGLTLGAGRTYMMRGTVHLVPFAAFLFLALVP